MLPLEIVALHHRNCRVSSQHLARVVEGKGFDRDLRSVLFSVLSTGEDSSTSPWWRSLVTSTRWISGRGTGSESGLAMVDNDTKIRASPPARARTAASALTCRGGPGHDGSAPIGVQFAQVPARFIRPTGPTNDPDTPHVP